MVPTHAKHTSVRQRIVAAWERTKLAQLMRVETDPHPELSDWDRRDGLR